MNVKHIIIHHTATTGETTRFESVRYHHVNTNGWRDIGYHYFIEHNGTIKVGRMETETGAHCRADNMNSKSLGIALAGDFTREEPTAQQKRSLNRLIGSIKQRYQIESILGHGEVEGASTDCPGKNFLLPNVSAILNGS